MIGLGLGLTSSAVNKLTANIVTLLNLGYEGLITGGNLDNSRATTATFVDFEGATRTARAGETRMQGAWRVENLLSASENFADAAWVVGAGGSGAAATKTPNYSVAPDGTTTACLVQLTKNAGTTSNDYSVLKQVVSSVTNSRGSIWLKSNEAGNINVTIGTSNVRQSITLTQTWQRFTHPVDTSATTEFRIELLGGQTPINPNTANILIWHPMFEDKTSSTNTAPAPYLSSAIEYNATVNGVKYFGVQNGNTVAANVVTEAVGATISPKPYILLGATDNIKVVASSGANWQQTCGLVLMRFTPSYSAAATSMTHLFSVGDLTYDLLDQTGTAYLDQTGVDLAAQANGVVLAVDANLGYVVYDGTAEVTSSTSDLTSGVTTIVAVAWDSDEMKMDIGYSNDGGVTFTPWHEADYDGAFDLGTYIEWFKDNGGVNYLHRCKIYSTNRKTLSQVRSWTERNAAAEMA